MVAPLSSKAACPQPPQDGASFLLPSREQTPPCHIRPTSGILLGSTLARDAVHGCEEWPASAWLGGHYALRRQMYFPSSRSSLTLTLIFRSREEPGSGTLGPGGP